MPYGNNSSAARDFNALVAVTWKFVIVCVMGPGILYLDIASGANYFQKAFEPFVVGSFNFDVPGLGHVGWSHSVMLGFLLSAITSGIQITLWNFAKVAKGLRKMSWLQLTAVIAAWFIFCLDLMSDLGGATMWVSDTSDGSLWPANANMFQMITIPVIVIAGVANEAILEYFFGIDKPMTKKGRMRVIDGGKSNAA
jgi:hypothetical protein